MSTLKRYNGTNWENVGNSALPKTTKANSDTDTYSCNYINGINTYSTDEVNTGKVWIDGKPIYRKVYHNSSYSQNGGRTEDVSFALPDLDIITNVYGSSKVNNVCSPLPSALWSNAVGTQYSFSIGGFTSTGFKITTGSDNPLNNAQLNITFEYVKTTD